MSSTAERKREKKLVNWKTEQQNLPNLNIRETIDLGTKIKVLRELWEYNERSNILEIGDLEQVEKEDGDEKVLKEIIAENNLKLARDINLHVQEAEQILNRII